MTFLPIVDRELRVAARRIATYRTRTMSAVVAGLIVGGMLLIGSWTAAPSQLGGGMFRTLVLLAFLHCLIAGAQSTYDCVSAEKREGTLGLLFLTDLKGYDVVLGKLAVTSLNSFYGLLAMLPLLAISLTIGGVTAGEYWRVVLVLANALFLALTIGLFVSAISRQERRAMAATYGLVFFFALVGPAAGALLNLLGHRPAPWWLLLPSPGYAWQLAYETLYLKNAGNFWWSLMTVHLLSWLFLALASLLLPRFWQEKSSGPLAGRAWNRSPDQHRASTAEDAQRRGQVLDINPVLWLASESRALPNALWTLIGVLTVGFVLIARKIPGGRGGGAIFLNVFVGFAYFCVLRILIAIQASRFIAEARRTGLLELLLATPLTVDEVMRGHLLAMRRMFFWPVMIILAAQAACFIVQLYFLDGPRQLVPFLFFSIISPAAAFGSFVADAWAMSWVGMWMGLTAKNTGQATMKTLVRVLILPLLLFVFIPVFWILFLLPGGWSLAWIVKNVIIVQQTKTKLRQKFRLVAAQAYDPELSESGWWFRRKRTSLAVPPVIRAGT